MTLFSKPRIFAYLYRIVKQIYADSNFVVIVRTDSNLCAVKNLELYLVWGNILADSNEFIFHNLTKCMDMYILRRDDKALSRSRMRELFIQAFQSFVPDIKKFGLHSLRSGGATTCANLRISDRLFKKHGRWRSETAKDGYVMESLPDRLSVSKNLGL